METHSPSLPIHILTIILVRYSYLEPAIALEIDRVNHAFRRQRIAIIRRQRPRRQIPILIHSFKVKHGEEGGRRNEQFQFCNLSTR